ncbi:uncharacterized protein C1orf131 homolog [Sabethes cyaneus]|uniref:uncharacterized protein C1orf131 homolog n=1 Tax=Sabethes cyaneus TaxID=53552 RepID=UPI00237DBE76|nr:uncharacterized protein C1orf131 homolog [Sabethes cyaneus]XP_053692083.1 uncharacterized protein C1orf131 homolog [Sabethes cyaneus]
MDNFVPVPTKASLLKKCSEENEFKLVVFEPVKAKKNKLEKPKSFPLPSEVQDKESGTESEPDIADIFSDAYRRKRKPREDPRTFDISRARKEVINFGISGLDKETKHEARVALAIKLGAKPPKNVYRNYKEILADRKREKEDSERASRRRKGQSFGAAKSFQQHQLRARQKAAHPGSVTRHYGVVDPKIRDKKRRKK